MSNFVRASAVLLAIAIAGGPAAARPAPVRVIRCTAATELSVRVSGCFAAITGTGDLSSGLSDDDLRGGLSGDTAGWGTIGTGRYGTIGHGSGTGAGYGVGGGRGGMHGRTAAEPTIHIGQPQSVGDLDRAII